MGFITAGDWLGIGVSTDPPFEKRLEKTTTAPSTAIATPPIYHLVLECACFSVPIRLFTPSARFP
jgi:hypothetical protein